MQFKSIIAAAFLAITVSAIPLQTRQSLTQDLEDAFNQVTGSGNTIDGNGNPSATGNGNGNGNPSGNGSGDGTVSGSGNGNSAGNGNTIGSITGGSNDCNNNVQQSGDVNVDVSPCVVLKERAMAAPLS